MKKTQIIVKRSSNTGKKKKGGGAWKVAFADFTLAMMAFFMVMWILEVTNKDERKEIAEYLRSKKLFSDPVAPFEPENSPFPQDLGGTPSAVPLDAEFLESRVSRNIIPGMSQHLKIPSGDDAPHAGKGEKLNSLVDGQFDTPSQLSLLTDVIEKLADDEGVSAHIQVDKVESGLRVIIRDSQERQIFERGQVHFTPFFEDLMISLGQLLGRINNRLVISGHTDATYYKASEYSNWELSGDRAQMARKTLVTGGLPIKQVAQVNAYGSTRPLTPDTPNSSENRRVELLILTSEASEQLDALFSPKSKDNLINKAASKARGNKPVMQSLSGVQSL